MIRNKIPSNASYLSSCDFINKYTLLQVEKAPFISKVLLELASTDVYNALEKINQKDRSSETKTRLFLVLYIFRIFQPIICCNFIAKVKEIDKNFLLRISFSTEQDIQSILTVLFTENWRPSFEKLAKYQEKIFNFKINAESLFGIEKFLENNLSDLDSSKLHINCKFVFENKKFKSRKVSTKMIRNIVPFWISC
jgi:hypothetical protein